VTLADFIDRHLVALCVQGWVLFICIWPVWAIKKIGKML
jgi:hypothetical protein